MALAENSSSVAEVRISGEELETVTIASNGGRLLTRSNRAAGGVFITWEDLWVTVPVDRKTEGKRRSILGGVTGYAGPGELLAIMGPSGCGKSTLLDALAGRLRPATRQNGDILVNGRRQQLPYGTSAYVTQDDASLISTLTVREAVCYSAQLQLPSSISKADKISRAETIIREMGLQDAMNTRIGGWGVKGLSGGQKRRLSICIEILTRPKLLFLDEPTSGLDSAASFYVMSRIARQKEGKTIIASIHQPSSEVFSLFQNVCLLSAGRTVYFGPASAANEFFAVNGFPCPTLQTPSDHFLKTINKDFDEASERKIPTEEVIAILVNSYKSSEMYKEVQGKVSEICMNEDDVLPENRKNADFMDQCMVLTRRSCLNMYRDIGYYWARLAFYIVQAIGLGTIYFSVIGPSQSSIQAIGNLLMFVASYLTFMAIGGFPSFVEEMKVFLRERMNGHYSPSAFIVGNTVSALPYLLLVALIPGAIIYFLSGLQKDIDPGEAVSRFFYFTAMLFVCMMVVESMMMLVAALVPNFLIGIITGAGIQGLMMLGGGFFRLPNDLPTVFWKYPLFFITFHRYAFQGLYKNEFHGRVFSGQNLERITGESILKNVYQVEMGYSKWVDLAVLTGMVVVYRVMFLIIVKAGEKIKPAMRALMSVQPKKDTQIMAVAGGTISAGASPF